MPGLTGHSAWKPLASMISPRAPMARLVRVMPSWTPETTRWRSLSKPSTTRARALPLAMSWRMRDKRTATRENSVAAKKPLRATNTNTPMKRTTNMVRFLLAPPGSYWNCNRTVGQTLRLCSERDDKKEAKSSRRQLFSGKHNQNLCGRVDTRLPEFLGYCFTAKNPVKLSAVLNRLELASFSKTKKNYDQSQRAYKEVRTDYGSGSHLVRGGERPDCRFSWPQRRGQDHHDAHVDVFPASHIGGGVSGGLRRARTAHGSEKADRLFAGDAPALSRDAGDGVSAVCRQAQGIVRVGLETARGLGMRALRYHGCDRQAAREAVERLPAARWTGAGHSAQSGRADSGRTDRGTRPQANQ